jgi:hypothetical protein
MELVFRIVRLVKMSEATSEGSYRDFSATLQPSVRSSALHFATTYLDSHCVANPVVKYCHDELEGPELGYCKWQLPADDWVEGAPQRDQVFHAATMMR